MGGDGKFTISLTVFKELFHVVFRDVDGNLKGNKAGGGEDGRLVLRGF